MARLAHVAGLETHIGAVYKRIFTVASHLVMCIWDTVTAVDAPLSPKDFGWHFQL